MTLVYLDTETFGLNPSRHEVWEIAYAVGDGPVKSSFVTHQPPTLDDTTIPAVRINGYLERYPGKPDAVTRGNWEEFEGQLRLALTGATLVASNPSFDTAMLRQRWFGEEPWHHRKIDIASFALPIVGMKNGKPKGLYDIAEALGVQVPDHTAAGDVFTLRECYRKLWDRYNELHGVTA